MKSKILMLVLIVALLFTGCGREAIDDDVAGDEPKETAIETDEPDKPVKTKDPDGSEKLVVHNAKELVKTIAPGKHIYLEPGDYDLQKVTTETKYFNEFKSFENLEDVTLEGVGDIQVDFYCEDIYASVLTFTNCQSITLINLNIGHTPESDLGGSCEGMVLCFMDDCSDIRIENCTMFGCGSVGLYASYVTDLTCIDSVITDCSYTIMTLNEVSKAQFKNCQFEDNEATYFEIDACEDVVFTDCLMSGYPDIPYFVSYKDMGMEVVFSQDTPGAVSSKEFEGITLKNVTFSMGEPSAAVKEELMKEEAILEGLTREFPEADCTADISSDPLSGESVLDIYIDVDAVPRDAALLEFVMQVMDVLSENPLKMPFSLGISDDVKHYYFVYNDLKQAAKDYAREPKSILRHAQYIFFNDISLDYNTLFDNTISYIDADEGSQFVKDLYPEFVSVYPEFDPVIITSTDVNYSISFYQYGSLYHMYYVDIGGFSLYFNVLAQDGSVMEFLGGEVYTVTRPDEEVLKAGVAAFINDGYDVLENEAISVRQLGDNILEFVTATHYLTYYSFESIDGELEFTRYIIEEGD
jgi:hypothetical protein